jgi:hypothetical protein
LGSSLKIVSKGCNCMFYERFSVVFEETGAISMN